MKLSNLIAGLQVLSAHYNNPDDYNTSAEHDQLYAFKTDRPLSSDEFAKMKELGWFQPELDDENAEYDPQEGWSAYT